MHQLDSSSLSLVRLHGSSYTLDSLLPLHVSLLFDQLIGRVRRLKDYPRV